MSSLNLKPISAIVEQYMLDEITIVRPNEPTLDATTLLLTKTSVEIYVGKAFIAPEGIPFDTTLGGEQMAQTRYEVAIPADSVAINPNDIITCDTSQFNPGMEGVKFIVVGQIESTFYTHRRLTCFKDQDAS